jgi:hypothetical protein
MRVLRLATVLVLGLALGASQASAAQVQREPIPRGLKPDTHSIILERLGSLLMSLWSKAGCKIDPLGNCVASTTSTDTGCGIDPLGRCAASTPTGDTGCTIDRWGGCSDR